MPNRRLPAVVVEHGGGRLLSGSPSLLNPHLGGEPTLAGVEQMPPAPNGSLRAPLSFTDAQIEQVRIAAFTLPRHLRSDFLKAPGRVAAARFWRWRFVDARYETRA